ncbi:ATP-binding protein [Geomonas oryzae]|uniref:ATP-binding protein n=1 Tax=Geomonas oryzae TaxID=2364273 RepID=UPI00100AE200|nr:ATP-binding protein [Geomonas oryzae]
MVERFPHKLLSRSLSERLDYFESYTLAHPRLKEANKEITRYIRNSKNGTIIYLYGPSGVGKTTLLKRLNVETINETYSAAKADQGCIPVIYVEAPFPESRNFDWRDFYIRSLTALEEPLIDYKITYGVQGVRRNEDGKLKVEKDTPIRSLRIALENALRYRNTSVFLVDEAQHFTKMTSGRTYKDQLNCLKSFVNLADVVLVLGGTYELLTLHDLSDQLCRRGKDVHFKRYFAADSKDMDKFENCVYCLQNQMPLKGETNLVQYLDYLYERSLGCVGILKPWLDSALHDALFDGTEVLLLKHLQDNALPASKCEKILLEAISGESEVVEKKESVDALRKNLGLSLKSNFQSDVKPTEACAASNSIKPKKSKKRRVGQRKPHRDPVGIPTYEES